MQSEKERTLKKKVFITQACDAGNKGDQGILKSQIALIRKLFPNSEIYVATWWSKELLKRVEPEIRVFSPLVDFKVREKEVPLILYPQTLVITFFLSLVSALSVKFNIRPIYRGDYLIALNDVDVVISSGHQPFVEGSMYGPRTIFSMVANDMVLLWGALDVFIAKKIFSKRFATFPQSVGPFFTLVGRFFARFIFGNLDAVCVREDISKTTLTQLNIKTPIYSLNDMAFFFEPTDQRQVALRRPIVGVSPCYVDGMTKEEKAHYVSVLVETLQKVHEKYGANILFLPSQTTKGKSMSVFGNEDDLEVSRTIQKSMITRFGKVDGAQILFTESVDMFANAISQLDMLIATRMHPTIFAAGSAVPFVEIIYEHKQIGLLKTLSLLEVGINVNDISFEKLFEKSDLVWNHRIEIRNCLKEKVAFLRSRNLPVLENLVRSLVTAD